jgi:hypothetical protein
VQQELQEAYGNVNNIDAFEGGLAEDPVPGSDVGPLFQKIMVDQFTALRDGDRFFYLNETWNADEMNLFAQADTLTKVIEANTDVRNLQPDVFIFEASISGVVSSVRGRSGPGGNGVSGITVNLEDSSGDILATAVTNRQGQYLFNQLSGPAANVENASGVSDTGDYQVVIHLPSGMEQVSPNPPLVLISSSGMNVNNVNFVVGSAWGAASQPTRSPGGTGNSSPCLNQATNSEVTGSSSNSGTNESLNVQTILPDSHRMNETDNAVIVFDSVKKSDTADIDVPMSKGIPNREALIGSF